MTIRPLMAILVLIACLFLTGCGDNGGTEPAGTGVSESERASQNASFVTLLGEAQKHTFHTLKQQLVDAKRRAEELRAKFEKLTDPTPLESSRLQALTQLLARLNAALAVQEARGEWEDLLKKATLTPKEAKLPIEARRDLLRQQWPAFRAADDKVIGSERSYTEATNKLAAALKRVRDLEQAEER